MRKWAFGDEPLRNASGMSFMGPLEAKLYEEVHETIKISLICDWLHDQLGIFTGRTELLQSLEWNREDSLLQVKLLHFS